MVYAEPHVEKGRYSIEFFIHGIRHTHGDAGNRHLHGDVMTWCQDAEEGDNLYPLLDIQNEFDVNAVALRASEGTIIVGYVPRFYSRDLRLILGQPEFASTAKFRLLRNKHDSPLQFRMLCRFTSNVPDDFRALDDPDREIRPTMVPYADRA